MRKLNSVEYVVGVGLLIFTTVLIYKKRGQKKMKKFEAEKYLNPIEESVKEHDPANLKMTKFEEEEFINRIKGMSRQELEIVADILPIDLCMARIQKELDKAKRVEDYIRNTVNMFE